VAQFLSDAWIESLDAAGAQAAVAPDLDVVVQQVVVDGEDEVAYVVRVGEGRVRVTRGRDDGAQVSFTQNRATAGAIARGELAAQAAFMDGRLRVGGDLRALLHHAAVLAALEDVFAPARAETTW
jgi:putative sterol carrier protein